MPEEYDIHEIAEGLKSRCETAALEAVYNEIDDAIGEDHPERDAIRAEVFNQMNL
jgi:hypothetical protein